MFTEIIKKHKRWDAVIIALLMIGAFIGVYFSFNQEAAASVKGPIRLHIIANSDGVYDQTLKLQVRDKIVAYLTPKLEGCSNVSQSEAIIKAELGNLQKLAQNMTKATGYSAHAEYGVFPFPTKSYGALTLKAGDYKALRIVLGAGKGHNWWCVLFPPLCLVDEAGQKQNAVVPVAGNLNKQTNVEIRFKLSDLFFIAKY